MATNRAHLSQLQKALDDVGEEIRAAAREPELKRLASQLQHGAREIPQYILEVFDRDPVRAERLCAYYFFLFAEFEAMKREKLHAKRRGSDAHKEWLNSDFTATTQYVQATRSLLRSVAAKIAVFGITAGLIWLGKMIVENGNFGCAYTPKPVQNATALDRREEGHAP